MSDREHDRTAEDASPSISRRQFAVAFLAILALAALLRGLFPVADPPWRATVGIVWHDEGAWTHNARNMALFGAWKQDEWNPMFITPVLTALEYGSFSAFGVGLWQARLVSEVMGLLSVLLMGLGVARLAGRAAGLAAAALMATNYIWVMYNRAALMEATMVSLAVTAWYGYARSISSRWWGILAGVAAMLAYFTKASGAFFVAALGIEAVLTATGWDLRRAWRARQRAESTSADDEAARRAALVTLAALVIAGLVSLAVFVWPNWAEYRFYNWQMSVTRKPSYTLKALMDRASWFPVIHDFFTRMWMLLVAAAGAGLGLLTRWRSARPAERLLALWFACGALELLLHDVGNERRLVVLIPALVGLAALTIARDRRLLSPRIAEIPITRLVAVTPLVLYVLYLLAGSAIRIAFLYQVRPSVRWSAAAALGLGVLVYGTWPRVARVLSRDQWSGLAAIGLTALIAAGDLAQFTQWAVHRTAKNYAAMRAIGEWLPPGTPVHGKLANGLALESRIRPVFVGRGFGNYDDRTRRHDIRYLVTYLAPYLGYEGPVIREVLEAYPNRRVVREFDVAESPGGRDRAALIDKGPPASR